MRGQPFAMMMPQGLTSPGSANSSLSTRSTNSYHAAKSMRVKLRGTVPEVSERRQVGDAEELLGANEETQGARWRNVGMEDGM